MVAGRRHTLTGTYSRIIERDWPARRLDEPTATDIGRLVHSHRENAVVRSNARDGHGAVSHFVSAFRRLYSYAERDRLIDPRDNPAAAVPRPRPLPGLRHALSAEQILEFAHVAATTGNDPGLDALIIRLHIETACRRQAVPKLALSDPNVSDCLIRLGKGHGGALAPHLRHADASVGRARRPAGWVGATDRVLRYRTGRSLGRRRYDTLTERIREHLSWAAALGVSTHWIRHTILTWVEREFGMGGRPRVRRPQRPPRPRCVDLHLCGRLSRRTRGSGLCPDRRTPPSGAPGPALPAGPDGGGADAPATLTARRTNPSGTRCRFRPDVLCRRMNTVALQNSHFLCVVDR
ncbi:hypothetical protein [Nocardia shimofusensis]|uniref:hypothetical protein n=1 Tax=Nocardia shimofusensis TaxID=228596 RepID=UPI000A91299B|nr:hypothetical protein [Nocardia shimofusensis]